MAQKGIKTRLWYYITPMITVLFYRIVFPLPAVDGCIPEPISYYYRKYGFTGDIPFHKVSRTTYIACIPQEHREWIASLMDMEDCQCVCVKNEKIHSLQNMRIAQSQEGYFTGCIENPQYFLHHI